MLKVCVLSLFFVRLYELTSVVNLANLVFLDMKDALSFIDGPAISVSYAFDLLDVMEARGIPSETIIKRSKVPKVLFERVDGRLSPRQFVMLIEACTQPEGAGALMGDASDLGYEFGLHVKPTSHGLLGFAMMNCRTAREAAQIAERFSALRGDIMRLRFHEGDDFGFLQIEGVDKLLHFRKFVLEVMMGALIRFASSLLGSISDETEIWVDYSEPAYFPLWKSRLPKVRFNMPHNQLRFPVSVLDKPLSRANPLSARAAVAQMETQMVMVSDMADMTTRVRAVLESAREDLPSLGEVAASLNISSSTLKRRLQQEGTTFQQQLDEVRRARAMNLLKNTGMSIELVTRALGYSDAANFTRAFRKWTGMSPSVWRKSH